MRTSEMPTNPPRRVFTREYAPEGYTPSSQQQHGAVGAAVDQRRQLTLKRISDLKLSLSSIVSSSRGPSFSASTVEDGDRRGSYSVSLERSRRYLSSEEARRESPEVHHTSVILHHDMPHAGVAEKTAPLLSLSSKPSPLGLANQSYLLDAHRQVEKLTLENHALVRRCLEQENYIAELQRAHQDDPCPRAKGTSVSPDDSGDVEGEGTLKGSGEVQSPRDLPFFSRYAHAASSRTPQTRSFSKGEGDKTQLSSADGSSARDDARGGELPEAIYGLLHRVSVCYPELLQGIASTPGDTASALTVQTAIAVPTVPSETATESPSQSPRLVEDAVVSGLSETGVCAVLWRMENILPGLVSSSRLGDLFTETGAELLDRINTLEDEKQADYFKVLDITEKLQTANKQLKAQNEARLQQITDMDTQLAELRMQRSQLIEQLAAERVAKVSATASPKADRGEHDGEKDRLALAEALKARTALEERLALMAAQHQSEVTPLQEKLAEAVEECSAATNACEELKAELERREATTTQLDAERERQLKDLERQLEEKRQEVGLQSVAIDEALAQMEALSSSAREEERARKLKDAEALRRLEELQERCAEQEEQLTLRDSELRQLRAEGEVQPAAVPSHEQAAWAVQLQAVTAERDALASELAARASVSVTDTTTQNDSQALLPEKEEVDEEGEEPSGTAESANGASAELRKAKQSLRRMTSERAGLKRKLERQGSLLSEAQEKLSASELQMALLETEVARLKMEKTLGQPRAAGTPHKTSATQPSHPAVELLAFDKLEMPSEGVSDEDLSSVASLPTSWLTTVNDVPVASCISQLEEAAQIQFEAGGALYHVGIQIATDAGLLRGDGAQDRDALAWKRLLLQIQHCVQSRGSLFFSSSAYAAECAQLYYALLCDAGFLRSVGRTDDRDAEQRAVSAPMRWALVVAGLCQFVGAPRGEEVDGSAKRDAAPGGESRWRVAEQILDHVASANHRMKGGDVSTPVSYYGTFAAAEKQEACAVATLRSLLMYDDGPMDGAFGCNLQKLVLHCCALRPGSDSSRREENNALLSEEQALCIPIAQLFLRLSRETVFFRSSAAWPPVVGSSQSRLSLYGRAVLCDASSSEIVREETGLQGRSWRDAEADISALGERLCTYLDGTVLPLVLTASRVLTCTLMAEPKAADALIAFLARARSEIACADGDGGACRLLSAADVEALADWFAASAENNTERELLDLYKENATYRGYIGKLLASIENK